MRHESSSAHFLDKAFEFAVILAWEDLRKGLDPCSVRVEYQCEPGTPLDQVTVWSTGAQSHQYRVCDYWTPASLSHAGGVSFRNGYRSDRLAETLGLIMTNQGGFTRPADTCRDGLALIYPPTDDARAGAGIWLSEMQSTHPAFGNAALKGPLPASP
ncbi:MAG: hypothetical protein ACRD3O_01165 [Terriglobia bacterium]